MHEPARDLAVPATSQYRTVADFLETDHRRLDAIMVEIERLLSKRSIDQAANWLNELTHGLDWHINAEEQVLFPMLEQASGEMIGPTAVMREEHRQIRQLLQHASAALRENDAPSASAVLDRLGHVLSAHNVKEERVLYPLADQLAGSDREREALVQRLAAT